MHVAALSWTGGTASFFLSTPSPRVCYSALFSLSAVQEYIPHISLHQAQMKNPPVVGRVRDFNKCNFLCFQRISQRINKQYRQGELPSNRGWKIIHSICLCDIHRITLFLLYKIPRTPVKSKGKGACRFNQQAPARA